MSMALVSDLCRRWQQVWTPLMLAALLAWAPAGQARELLVVGTEFPRIYEAAKEGGDPSGLGVDLLTLAAARLGHSLRFEHYPWLRAQAMVERGLADILVGPYRTTDREQRYLFSPQPFYEDALVFYARSAQSGLWRGDYAALGQRPVAQVQGWAYGESYEQARASLRISTVRDVNTGLQMLRLGRVDLFASNERNTEPVLQRLGLAQELVPAGPPIGQLRGHFAYPRDKRGQVLRDELERAIAALRASGELDELSRRWKVKIPE
ncbi:transporter substrate-binding domain-containing protein [Paucibacter sp. PLA-PC-4]|uniref:substrate-binding periplasmic protein n=1 Tax=Paucibacter sp. PLA-PC-4 TaxID=2993655 RepID=UPI0022489EFA|nr:transporter substrate-binding domain-containing protein [Paucibacter sp. PLA-PC-4]MCX2860475.1 transporter substrate-binding domain-containing protein [Paucibacter sp. PLA-PC-4]